MSATTTSADMLAPTAATWVRGFSLTPAEPRITALVLDGVIEIPLRSRSGIVVACTVVDSADGEWANQWRWYLNSSGYAQRGQRLNGRQTMVRLHRQILGLSQFDSLIVDHINRDKLDNRRSNLRVVTRATNTQNVASRQGASSCYRGVTWHPETKKWAAQVNANGKHVHCGLFESEIDAAAAARDARRRLLPYSVD